MLVRKAIHQISDKQNTNTIHLLLPGHRPGKSAEQWCQRAGLFLSGEKMSKSKKYGLSLMMSDFHSKEIPGKNILSRTSIHLPLHVSSDSMSKLT